MISFQTARLNIRPLLLTDAEDVFAMRRNPEVAKWGFKQAADTSISETINWILTNNLSPTNQPYINYKFAICELIPDTTIPKPTVIGTLGVKLLASSLHPEDKNRVRWELGYGLHASVWGKGYATEAVKGVIDHFGEITQILREEEGGKVHDGVVVEEGLWASTAEENLASQGVLRKCGFGFMGGFEDEVGRSCLDFRVLV
ncbi:hypothetical protein ETB97_001146 [Aspergillus alliaceus]|uniref:N-acetyltransferase domain-containing protein n=1 Tax=Petromyces alliaceus TaxID=209559 RepID=A0A8H6AGW1_PETAA|nr:hypothetical protein ETB97_001146 [Aspergillus burnettii]